MRVPTVDEQAAAAVEPDKDVRTFSDADVAQALDGAEELTIDFAEPLGERIAEYARKVPWIAASVAAHLLLLWILALVTFSVAPGAVDTVDVSVTLKKIKEGKEVYLKKEDVDQNLQDLKMETFADSVKTEAIDVDDVPKLGKNKVRVIGTSGGGGDQGDFQRTVSVGIGGGEVSFFGSRAGSGARRVCFIVDKSGSMCGDRLTEAKEEIKQTVKRMSTDVRFGLMFFEEGKFDEFGKGLVSATIQNKIAAFKFIDSVECMGLTNPLPALITAFKYDPQLIYLLTDGEFEAETIAKVREMNRKRAASDRVRVNTIAFKSREGERILKKLASESRGKYKYVK